MVERPKKELEFRTETKAEEDAELHRLDFDVLPETRERREDPYQGPAWLDYLAAAAGGREVTGAAREYADACGVAPFGKLPMLIFPDGQPETRAITPGPAVKGALQPIVPYLFERSAAASLGIEMPSVPAGQVQLPKIGTAPPSGYPGGRTARRRRRRRRSLSSTQAPVRIAGSFEVRELRIWQ